MQTTSHRTTSRPAHRGFTIIEVAVGLASAALLATTAIVATSSPSTSLAADRSHEDGKKLRDLMVVLHIYASENNDQYMRPGTLGNDNENIAANTTANFCSLMITQRWIAPEALISPIDRNPNVKVHRPSFDAYDPAAGVYWDPTFAADLAQESNTSYAHIPIVGKRAETLWHAAADPARIQIGNRGPLDGTRNVDSHCCDPHGFWSGWVGFADGHVELLRDMTPDILVTQENPASDNLFAVDEKRGSDDALLTFTRQIEDGKPVLQHD